MTLILSDLTTTGALVAAILGLVEAIKYLASRKPKRNGENGSKAAGLTAGEWKSEIRKAVLEALTENAPKRHEDLRKLFKEIMAQEFAGRNEALRKMMYDVIGDWLDARYGRSRDRERN